LCLGNKKVKILDGVSLFPFHVLKIWFVGVQKIFKNITPPPNKKKEKERERERERDFPHRLGMRMRMYLYVYSHPSLQTTRFKVVVAMNLLELRT